MPIATLLTTPGTAEEWAAWSFAHMDMHRRVNQVLYNRGKGNLTLFVLDPMDLDNLSAWVEQHQQMHAEQDGILGIAGYDLSYFNPRDPQGVQVFIDQNYQLHYAEALATGVW